MKSCSESWRKSLKAEDVYHPKTMLSDNLKKKVSWQKDIGYILRLVNMYAIGETQTSIVSWNSVGKHCF